MLTILHSSNLTNYDAVLGPEKRLLSFVTLTPETTYFFVCYGKNNGRNPGVIALLWRPHDVIALLDHVSVTADQRINQFSVLKYATTESGPKLEYQNIKEFWLSRDEDNQNFVFSYKTEDGISHTGHTSAPGDGVFDTLLRVF